MGSECRPWMQTTHVQILAPPPTSCATLSKLIYLPEPQFPLL